MPPLRPNCTESASARFTCWSYRTTVHSTHSAIHARSPVLRLSCRKRASVFFHSQRVATHPSSLLLAAVSLSRARDSTCVFILAPQVVPASSSAIRERASRRLFQSHSLFPFDGRSYLSSPSLPRTHSPCSVLLLRPGQSGARLNHCGRRRSGSGEEYAEVHT